MTSLLEEMYIPRDTDAEMAVLGGIMCLNAFPEVSYRVQRIHFNELHARIWDACRKVFDDNGEVRTNLVLDEIKRRHDYEIGDLSRAMACTGKAPIYAGKPLRSAMDKMILNHSRREAMERLNKTMSKIHQSEDPASDIMKASVGLSGTKVRRSAGTIREWMDETDYMDEFVNVKQKPMFSGSLNLDEIMGGFHKGEMSFIAARPGVGKTSLALSFSRFMSKNGFRPAFVSAEMSVRALLDRMLAMESGKPVRRFRSGQNLLKESPNTAKLIMDGMGKLSETDMLFVNAHGKGPEDIRSAIMPYWSIGKGPDIMFVDYVQLLRTESKNRTRNDEMAEISAGLLNLANEFDCHVCCLSQLSREGASGEPQLHHLRDSGTLEQDANQVIMAWKKDEQTNQNPNVTELLLKVAKNRDGMTGTCKIEIDFSTYSVIS